MEQREKLEAYLRKWQVILRMQDWDILLHEVQTPWRKTGDIKIDEDDHKAILMINQNNPKKENMEAVIVHELLHLRLWKMDQMIETLINALYGTDEQDARREIAYTQFMLVLESTVEDLAKAYMTAGGEDMSVSYGRLMPQVFEEIEKGKPNV